MNGRMFRIGLVMVAIGALGLTGFAGEGRSPLPGRPRAEPAGEDLALVDRARILDRIDGILLEIDALRRSRDPERGRLASLAAQVRLLRREVEVAPAAAPVPDVVEAPAPMEDREFRSFLTSVRRASFADDRVALVGEQAKFAFFTSAQAAEVVAAIQSWGRVDAAFALHPRVVDPESFHLVYRELTFSSDREELRERIEARARRAAAEDARRAERR